jgi:putative hydrolase of HD superfamily
MKYAALLEFALTLDKLKSVERRSRPAGLLRRENSAEHSWHAAAMALVLRDACAFPVDAGHAAQMLLLHDVPEIECGDTFLYDPARASAEVNEAVALGNLLEDLPAGVAGELKLLWQEYTAGVSPAACYAYAIDRLMPLLLNLANAGDVWREHGIKIEQVMAMNAVIAEVFPSLWPDLRERIEAMFESFSTLS